MILARAMRSLSGSVTCLVVCCWLSSCCHQPAESADQVPPGASADVPAASAAPAASPSPTTAESTAAVAHAGLAAKVCPAGPFEAPLSGEVSATPIPNTEPTALDPNDTEFHLYEGAVWLNGALYFSDFKTTAGFPSRILRYTPDAGLAVALADGGTNGLGLDAGATQLVGASHKVKGVVRFAPDFSSVVPLVDKYQGKPFNSPNDLVFRSDGNLYFTDPDFQAGPEKDQASTNVYRVAPTGEVSIVDDSIKNPNGISISPDESALFVAGNLEQGYLKRYPIAQDGSVGAGEVVLQPVTVPDGMVFDCAGNLYVTEHTSQRIRVVSMAGNEVGSITGLGKNVTNVAFGGPERKTLYITLTGGLAKLDLPVPGLPY